MAQRYFLEIAYKGTAYHGWQVQENALTVQAVLNQALETILRHPVETVGCGRTDTGVHASQHFVHLDADVELNERQVHSINAILPDDIALKRCLQVAPEAHARFDATLRAYEYHIHAQKNPFRADFSWLVKEPLDVAKMNEAATFLLDYTDFSCFSKSNTQTFTNNCKIKFAYWEETEFGLVFRIAADRFLRNMVRAIVGTLVDIGQCKIPPSAIRNIIESKNRSNAGVSVPACGLVLTEVHYPYI
ncbi:MAG: tRNA pseudouridine(38-40) synthase TruA [Sphingobacteriales bacterium]|nr:tRNA pseudouridine(38-40) synthase TruA [Sphingobacteriales bacterium]